MHQLYLNKKWEKAIIKGYRYSQMKRYTGEVLHRSSIPMGLGRGTTLPYTNVFTNLEAHQLLLLEF